MQKKILIVEHEVALSEALARRLRARGYEALRESSAAAALERFDESRPDLVVVSLTLPEDGGRVVCRGIRTRPLGALVPILFMGTGGEDVRNVSEAIAAGADHYFRKPDGLEELIGKIGAYIGPGAEAALEAGATEPGVAPVDAGTLAAALGAEGSGTPPPRADADTQRLYAAIRDVMAGGDAPPAQEALDDAGPTLPGAAPAGEATATTAAPDAPPAADGERGTGSAPAAGGSPPAEAGGPAVEPAPGDRAAADDAWSRLGEHPGAAGLAPPAPPPLGDVPGGGWRPPAPPPSAHGDELDALLDYGRAVPLERRGLGEILAAAASLGLRGRIEVASAGVLRRVFLEEGHPVYADGSEPAEDLAAHLVGEGLVARSTLAEVRARAEMTGATPEEVLIEAGYLQAEDVYRALRQYVIERVIALFGVEAGEAIVIRGGPRPLDPVDLGMHPGRLVLDGIRRKYGRLRLYRAFGTASLVPQPRSGREPPAGLVLRPDEEAVRRCVDGRRTVLEIARVAELGEVDALAVLYGLSVLGLVEAPPGRRRAGPLPPLDPEAVARAGAPRTADQMPGFAELVAERHALIRTADYYQILGVSRGATGAEIRAAWERLRRQFDPHRVRRDGPLWHLVRDIADVIDDAYAMLSSERLRALYTRTLE